MRKGDQKVRVKIIEELRKEMRMMKGSQRSQLKCINTKSLLLFNFKVSMQLHFYVILTLNYE